MLKSSVLAEQLTDESLRKLAITAQMSAQRAADLTGRLLAHLRHRSAAEPGLLDVREAICTLAPLLRQIVGPDVAIDVLGEPTACIIVADRTEFDCVILNLGLNARDAMPHGGRLGICVQSRPGYGALRSPATRRPWVRIAVADTGTGMPPEIAARACEPLFTTKGERGSGLGLARVESFVRRLGGHMDINSRVGAGTTVTLYLPPAPHQSRRR
jgi:signal transduction histidine kinase